MTTMTEERAPARPAQRTIRRPASGIPIDPARLTAWRERRAMSRQDLADAIAALGWADDNGRRLTYTRDAIAKSENGHRRPKPRTLKALCAALSADGDPCEPRDLMPGGLPVQLPPAARKRRLRLDYNADMRLFAETSGFAFRNPVTGRVYYSRGLREAYAQHVLDLAVAGSGEDGPQDDGTADLAREDLGITGEPDWAPGCPAAWMPEDTGAPGRPRLPRQDWHAPEPADPAAMAPLAAAVPDPDRPVEDIGLSVRVSNHLRRAGIRTAGQLGARSRADLTDIRNLGVKGLDEITAVVAELVRAPAAGEPAQLAS